MENFSYRVSLTWLNGRDGRAEASGVKESLTFSSPPEFGGRAGLWSPEQLLVLAASSCFLSTLLFFADRTGLTLTGYRAEAEGHLERSNGKGFQFAEIVLRPVIVVEKESDIELVRRLVERAERGCIVANSLMPPVRVEAQVETLLAELKAS